MRHVYTKELLSPIVNKSVNWSEVCRNLNITSSTGSQCHVKKRAIEFGINFDHFSGQGWRKGKKFGYSYPIEDYLDNKRFIPSDRLKKRLFEEGIKEKRCESCSLTEWLGEEVVFELDHINNNHYDNRLINLKINCPNCHSIKTRHARMVEKQTRRV